MRFFKNEFLLVYYEQRRIYMVVILLEKCNNNKFIVVCLGTYFINLKFHQKQFSKQQ